MIYEKFERIINKFLKKKKNEFIDKLIRQYIHEGRIPWSPGYIEYKERQIKEAISDSSILEKFNKKKLPSGYGLRLDERIVEYPWIINNVSGKKTKFLDAGSTFNNEYMLKHNKIAVKDITIYTYYPEKNCFHDLRVSYMFGDLRDIPFRNNTFDEIVCQSTLEHIDMDTDIYGYSIKRKIKKSLGKNYEFIKVLHELVRVLNPGGTMLITFPYGMYEDHGFQQQFDNEMLQKSLQVMSKTGKCKTTFFLYRENEWKFANQDACENSKTYNPNTGVGKGDDGAAHSRSICCIKYHKKRESS